MYDVFQLERLLHLIILFITIVTESLNYTLILPLSIMLLRLSVPTVINDMQ